MTIAVVVIGFFSAAAHALSCIDENPEVAVLEIERVTVDGKQVSDLARWKNVDTSLEATKRLTTAGSANVRLVVREKGNPGNWLFSEVYRAVP